MSEKVFDHQTKVPEVLTNPSLQLLGASEILSALSAVDATPDAEDIRSDISRLSSYLWDNAYPLDFRDVIRRAFEDEAPRLASLLSDEANIPDVANILHAYVRRFERIKRDDAWEKKEHLYSDTIKRVNDIHGVFGGYEAFRQKFPDYARWQEEAHQKIRQSHPKLKEDSEEFKSKVELSILVNHRSEIESSLPEEKKKEFARVFAELERTARSEKVAYSTTLPRIEQSRPKTDAEQAKQTFSEPERQNLSRHGDELRSSLGGDVSKVLDMRTGRVYTEGAGGIRIESGAIYGNPYETLVKIDTLETERSALQSDVRGGITKFNDIGKKFRLPEISAKNPDDFMSQARTMREGLLSHFRDQFKQGELSNQSDQDAAKNLLEIVMGEEMIREVADKMRRIEQIAREIEQLRRDEERRVPEYEENVRRHDETARGNLSYISSLRLDLIGQEGLEYVLDRINEERTLRKYPTISLKNGFSVDDREDLARMLEQLTGKEPPIFMQNEVPPRIRPDVDPAARLRAAGVLDGMNQFQKEKAKSILEQKAG